MTETYERMPLERAIKTIIDEHDISKYRLSKVLGLKTQAIITRYLKGEVKSVNTKTAYAIWKHYGILVDNFNTVEELKACYETL